MRKAVFFVLLLLCLSLIPNGEATTTTQTRYFGSSASAIYLLDGANFLSLKNMTDFDIFEYLERNLTQAYNGNIQIGMRAYRDVYDSNYAHSEEYEELTSGSVVVLMEKANNFEGWASGTWTSPAWNLSRLDYLEVDLFVRYKVTPVTWSSWYPPVGSGGIVTPHFYTESLGMDAIISSDWNFTFYLKCLRFTTPTIYRMVRIYLGNSTYNSRIENMQFDDGVTTPENNLAVGLILGLVIALPICLIFALSRKH